MRRTSTSSIPRSHVNSEMVRVNQAPSMHGQTYGHRLQDPNGELELTSYQFPYALPVQQSPIAIFNQRQRMSVMSHGESVISAYGLNPFSKNAARSVMGGSQYRAGSVVEGPYVIGYCAHGRSGSTTSARSSQIAMGGASVFSSDQPTNEQLANETQNVLAIADLMSITEKQVRTIYTSSESP